MVVMVLTPGLITCDPADLSRALHGDESTALPGRAPFCLAVVNRSDSCGADPEYNPGWISVLLGPTS